MTYHIIYSSEATMPMQSDDLEELLVQARTKNATLGISGALVYAEGMFLQIIEGEAATVKALMARIAPDLRHDGLAVLREGEIPVAKFSNWDMAYVSATRAQVARWAGVGGTGGSSEPANAADEDDHRTAQFAQDILALLEPGTPIPLAPE